MAKEYNLGEGALSERKELEPKTVLSLVIPTRNEAGNIPSLHARLATSLQGIPCEMLFVDDSDDNTPEVIRDLHWPMPVQMVVRGKESRRGGLSTAVLEGISRANGQYVGVMDADLQHPPEIIPTMLNTAIENDNDIVIGSRFATGGKVEGLASPLRKIASKGALALTQAVFPELRGVSDPMSGLFIVDKKILENAELDPQGFKILLEILVKTNWMRLEEIPIQFGRRMHGESKMDTKEAMEVLSHMFQLWKQKRKKK